MSITSFLERRHALVDTSAFFALAYSRESRHPEALGVAERLRLERWRLFTTNFILAETHALLLSRLNRALALEVLTQIEQSSTSVVRVTASDETAARTILARYQDKDFSLTDAMSFAVMERLGMRSAFTFDRKFVQYGFAPLTT